MVYLVLLLGIIAGVQSSHHLHRQGIVEVNATSSVMAIDKDIQYGQIMPYIDEWNEFWKTSNEKFQLSPFQFWFRCYENQVRGYFFFEDLDAQSHGKEATIRNWGYLKDHLKITADKVPVKLFRAWHGGGDFFFDLPANTSEDHNVDIQVKGFKHYTRFLVSGCLKKPVITPEKKYVMHIHLRDYSVKHEFKPSIIDGIANHMAYHRCALKLDKYEIVIQEDHLGQYLQNEKIAHAVTQGWITFLIRNPILPSPLNQRDSPSNCYYQAYTQNMAILQHWQENVKMYFWDSDEYLWVDNKIDGKELMTLVESHTAVGFKRKMIFCSSCDPNKAEIKTMSLTKATLALNDHVLMHPKLVVDPNKVGCYIVHWAGCGDETKELPLAKTHILHFENLHHKRWSIENRLKIGNETVFQPGPLQLTCDPVNYDWKGPLPSFHSLK